MFEIEARGFVIEKEDYENGEKVTACKDVAVAELDGRGDKRGKECEEEVPGPVPGGCEGGGIGSGVEGEHLADSDPNTWSPS